MKRPRKKNMGGIPCSEEAAVGETDGLLAEIRSITDKVVSLEARAQSELEAVRARYQAIAEYRYLLGVLDKRLKTHLKVHCGAIFRGSDKRGLTNGTVYFGHESKVSIPKTALQIIKEWGWRDGLKITETLNRPVVEKWPPKRLEAIGARLKVIEKFSYDLGRMP